MTSQQPSMDERQLRKQQIRPRFVDLTELDDDLDGDDGSFESKSRRAALGSIGDWPPAATVIRKKPPTIASSSKAEASTSDVKSKSAIRKPTVEDAGASQLSTPTASASTSQKSHGNKSAPSQPRTVRFTAETQDAVEREAGHTAPRKATLNLAGSIIGSIQERPAGERKTRPNGAARSKPSGSRFVVRRRMDEDLQKHEEQRQQRLQQESTPDGQEPGTGFPVVSHRDQITPILPPNTVSSRQHQYSEDIEAVDPPQRDALATQTALTATQSEAKADQTSRALGMDGQAAAATAEDEEWLDENGKPMSAFRKSRLLRQGLRPPSVRSKSNHTSSTQQEERDVPSFRPDPSRDPGGGADIDVINAVLSEASRENDQKLRQMSATEVSEELRSLESLFGKDVLEALRNRKGVNTSQRASEQAAPSITTPDAAASKPAYEDVASAAFPQEDKDGPLAIKRQYFPAEPEGPNPSLEWMMPQPSQQASASTDLRFDFSGKLLQRGKQTDETYLSGLHHHGDNQDAPGYTFAELLHLSRSTVAAQRQLALNVLGRICQHHPTFGGSDYRGDMSATALLNEHALLLRARIISVSRWLLGDRHFTVRAAALRCLASAVRSLPSSHPIPLGSTQELDFGRLVSTGQGDVEDRDGQAQASEVEKGIQKDWADVMLESNLLGLFLDRTDSVITSTWEAELALELLYCIASCSASHARRVFKDDPRKLCDFVIHLGLKVAWPPVPTDTTLPGAAQQRLSPLPSVTAVRLLHQGILSDRKIAESLVLSGSIEHLLRFVVTPPWKVEEDWVSDDEAGDAIVVVAYQIFDEVLRLFTSLASYGLFASVVARTWDLWQMSGSWAAKQLISNRHSDKHSSMKAWVREGRMTAAQSIFETLAAWTHCASDPHQLMTAHDITWTQVRDWIESIKDATQELASVSATQPSDQAPAFGALCAYTDAWLRCAIDKEPKILEKHFDACQTIVSLCQQPIQQHFPQVMKSFSSAPTQAMALDEAEQATRACHRYLDLTRTMDRAGSTKTSIADGPTLSTEASNVVMQESLALISSGPVWQALQSYESQASGRRVYQQTFSDFVAAALTASPGADADLPLQLAAIIRLDERHADRIALIVMHATEALAGAAIAHILQPFLLGCIVGANRMPEADRFKEVENRDRRPLSQVETLFRSSKMGGANEAADSEDAKDADLDDEEDERDVDPITGSKLWKCPASGLPIRADWPLLALDDLLHSASTAVFNRPDNLEEDWKPSELEMVRATLQLAVAVFENLLSRAKRCSVDTANAAATMEAKAMLSSLPSPEQILLGVMKVFMLEKDQPDTFADKNAAGLVQQKQSGTITGRDLFRDSAISSALCSLLDLADKLVELRQEQPCISTVTLDSWTAGTYGSGMSFYQFFTDLVGLWDSVSFGDANFARTVMTVANAGCAVIFEGDHGIAVDFRRLVWNDYSDSLRSMPPTPVATWLLSWTDDDEDMLEHYCRYLAGAAEMISARKGMAWQIASHHVGAALEKLSAQADGVAPSKRRETILRSLFVAKGESLLKELAQSGGSVSDEELQRLVARLEISSAAQ